MHTALEAEFTKDKDCHIITITKTATADGRDLVHAYGNLRQSDATFYGSPDSVARDSPLFIDILNYGDGVDFRDPRNRSKRKHNLIYTCCCLVGDAEADTAYIKAKLDNFGGGMRGWPEKAYGPFYRNSCGANVLYAGSCVCGLPLPSTIDPDDHPDLDLSTPGDTPEALYAIVTNTKNAKNSRKAYRKIKRSSVRPFLKSVFVYSLCVLQTDLMVFGDFIRR